MLREKAFGLVKMCVRGLGGGSRRGVKILVTWITERLTNGHIMD